ncbi:GumC family protein [Phascolarctobacterium faecium]|uniref:GumC family protein n=1 Tax=Phascolarctobacterium faecium TaxID=33025 RepID=UPI00210C8DE0|nr:GumC family protein [Phascolarctobacterium faecium]
MSDNNKDVEKEIDLEEVIGVLKTDKNKYLKIAAGCTIIALVLAFILPEKFSSTAVVRAKATAGMSGISSDMAAMAALAGFGNVKSDTQSYIEIMQTRSVIEPLIEKTDTLDADDEIKEYKLLDEYIKKYLKFDNPKGTDIIKITAISKDPQEAQQIAQGVVENMAVTLTKVNQTGTSSYRKFLEDRIQIADSEMKDAEAKLEAFKQKSGVFLPGEQATGIIEQLSEIDKSIAAVQVQRDTKAKQLELLDNGEVATVYNSGMDTAATEVRQALVSKELALKDAQQKYTDKHPAIIELKAELAALKAQVKKEAATEVAASNVRLNALNTQKAAIESKISQLSSDGLEYVELSRKVATTREVYSILVKSMESARIQEAMNSMDLQVIAEANLPLYKSWPPKAIITIVGAIVGFMACIGHAVWQVNKKY